MNLYLKHRALCWTYALSAEITGLRSRDSIPAHDPCASERLVAEAVKTADLALQEFDKRFFADGYSRVSS